MCRHDGAAEAATARWHSRRADALDEDPHIEEKSRKIHNIFCPADKNWHNLGGTSHGVKTRFFESFFE
jgi:hypothetical protein